MLHHVRVALQQKKLEAILSMAQKHRQDGSQRALGRHVENLEICAVL